MTHPHDQAPAPLTTDVVAQMVTRLRLRGQHQRSTWNDGDMEFAAADLLAALWADAIAGNTQPHPHDPTWAQEVEYLIARLGEMKPSEAALSTQLAERDAELARVTNELAASQNEAVMNYVELTTASRRIAALTEALTELLNVIDRGRQNHLTVDDCINAEHARALTTDKEPTT